MLAVNSEVKRRAVVLEVRGGGKLLRNKARYMVDASYAAVVSVAIPTVRSQPAIGPRVLF